ncbi:hypothetical protein EJ03DRAFT_168683 [Teratosphaeria nubilosa]|uniref:Uncharacterized protein n=1 Tax=Teratosphaeria nubilosa TaxID=161662 RepID=A0A6G1LIA6_9PEZI|nr:hypothetical protein EJ03DRAFT_168683 [Teratosphaeria nubilosa]
MNPPRALTRVATELVTHCSVLVLVVGHWSDVVESGSCREIWSSTGPDIEQEVNELKWHLSPCLLMKPFVDAMIATPGDAQCAWPVAMAPYCRRCVRSLLRECPMLVGAYALPQCCRADAWGPSSNKEKIWVGEYIEQARGNRIERDAARAAGFARRDQTFVYFSASK